MSDIALPGLRVATRAPAWTARVIVVLAVASLAFEQSPANEAVRANLAFSVLDHTGNAVLVGLAVFAITLVIEGVPGGLITAGLHRNPDLARRLIRRSGAQTSTDAETAKGSRVTSAITDVGVALGIGAGLVVVRRHWVEQGRTVRQDLRTGAIACLVVAVVSGIIGFLVAGGIRHAAKVGLETPAEYVVDYATDWRFWLVFVGVIQGATWLSARLQRRREPAADEPVTIDLAAADDRSSTTPSRPRRERPLVAERR